MNDHDSSHELQRIHRQAVFWYWLLGEPGLTEDEWQRFGHWYAVPTHREALEMVAVLRKRALRKSQAAFQRRARGRYEARGLLVLRIAAAIVMLFMLTTLGPATTAPLQRILQTYAAEAAWQLEDGSIVRAAPYTRLEVESGTSDRSLFLSRGKAFFRVEHDPARQFLVRTPLAVVKAVGTCFSVSSKSSESVVAVAEGTVAVRLAQSDEISPQSKVAEEIHLRAQERAQVLPMSIRTLPPLDLTELDWAMTIRFADVPVIAAVERYSKRNGVRLALERPETARKLVLSGVYQLDDPEGFAKTVANKTSAAVLIYRKNAEVQRVEPDKAQLLQKRGANPALK